MRYYDEDDWDGDIEFADPDGRSALRAASKGNPRIYSCPDCHATNVLTRKDVQAGYCCNSCADRNEGYHMGGYSEGEYNEY